MTLIYKEFTITGTVEEIKEFIELIENKNNTANSNIDSYDKHSYDKWTNIDKLRM